MSTVSCQQMQWSGYDICLGGWSKLRGDIYIYIGLCLYTREKGIWCGLDSDITIAEIAGVADTEIPTWGILGVRYSHRYYMMGNTRGQTQYLDIGKKYKLNAYIYIYKGRLTGEYIIISNLHEPPAVEQVVATQTTCKLLYFLLLIREELLSPTQQGPPPTRRTDLHSHSITLTAMKYYSLKAKADGMGAPNSLVIAGTDLGSISLTWLPATPTQIEFTVYSQFLFPAPFPIQGLNIGEKYEI